MCVCKNLCGSDQDLETKEEISDLTASNHELIPLGALLFLSYAIARSFCLVKCAQERAHKHKMFSLSCH